MDIKLIEGIAINTVVLIALGGILGIHLKKPSNKVILKTGLTGVLIGAVGILLMQFSFELQPGLFFDTRSILISVSAAFLGAFPTMIFTGMIVGFRIILGGSGMIMGILVSLVSATVGLIWRHFRYETIRKEKTRHVWIDFLVIGFATHILMLLLMFTLPKDIVFSTLQSLALPVLVIYPVGTLILSLSAYNNIKSQNMLAQLRESERSKSLLIANLPGLAYRCKYDEYWTMIFLSEGCKALTGYDPDMIINNRDVSFIDIIDKEFRDSIYEAWEEAIETDDSFIGEYAITTAQGEEKWVFEQGRPVKDKDGRVEALEGLIIDITDRKRKEVEIEYLSSHDYMTGLFNRIEYERQKIILDRGDNLPITVIFCDINGLKQINDKSGHEEGDRIIRKTASLLRDHLPEECVLARIGGDEFGIILVKTDPAAATRIANNIYDDIKESDINITLGYATKTREKESLFETETIAENFLNSKKLLERTSSHSSILSSIRATMHEKSDETEEHGERLGLICRYIGNRLHLPEYMLQELDILAELHDIGKIAIPDRILNKEGPLSADEWEEMKHHPEIGYRIAMSTPGIQHIAHMILFHHERWDGTGYPQGLKGHDIPLLSRILCVVDSFDAMTHNRVYRNALPIDEAIDEIRRCSGSQFDPDIAEIFCESESDIRSRILREEDDGK